MYNLLLSGYGEEGLKANDKIALFLKEKNIVTEFQATKHAIATYNYLIAEGRNVGAGLIPPLSYEASMSDAFNTLIDRDINLKLHDVDYETLLQDQIDRRCMELELLYERGKLSRKDYDKEIKKLRKLDPDV